MIGSANASAAASSADESLYGLMDELTARLQSGAPVEIEEFLATHPQHADRLRKIVPALEVLADLGSSRASVPSASAGAELEVVPEADLLDATGGVLGDFRLIREIGRGGMGVVYEAEQLSLQRPVALKVLPFAAVLDQRQLQRFKNEALAAASLHHTNIVPVHAVGCERGVHFYAMQYIEGHTLAEVIHALRRPVGPESTDEHSGMRDGAAPDGEMERRRAGASLSVQCSMLDVQRSSALIAHPSSLIDSAADTSPLAALSTAHADDPRAWFRRVAEIGIQVADALEYAHEIGITHRDVKPSNLLLDARGRVWITDFGLAQLETGPGITLTGDLLGTLRYMSPEQAQGRRDIDRRTDVYSLGLTLYELLTLRSPFASGNRQALLRQVLESDPIPLRRHNHRLPAELETIVLKCTEKSAKDRYATARELADDLRRFLDDRPITARRPTLVGRFRKWCRRRKALVTGIAIMAGLAAIGLASGGLLLRWEHQKTDYERSLRRQQQRIAEASSRAIAYDQYVTNLNLAAHAWDICHITQAREFLARCVPVGGEEDLRGVEWHYLWRLCHSVPPPFGKHSSAVYSAGFSPDGRLLATGGLDGVRIRDYGTGEQIGWVPHLWGVNTVSFSPDGRLLATAGDDRWVRIWDTSTWKLARFIKAALPLAGAEFAPAGEFFGVAEWLNESGAAPGTSSTVTIYNTSSWEKHYTARITPFSGGAFSPDGARSVIVSGPELQVLDLATRQPLLSTRAAHDLGHVAFPVGQPYVVTVGGGLFQVWPLASEHPEHSTARPFVVAHGHNEAIRSVSFLPDGKRLLSGSEDGMVRVWEFVPQVLPHAPLRLSDELRQDARMWCVRAAPDGQTLVTGSNDGAIRRWDLREPQEFRQLPAFDISALHFTPEGDKLIAVGSRVRVYDPPSGRQLSDFAMGSIATRMALSPDGRLLAAGTGGGSITFWDVEAGLKLWDHQRTMVIAGQKHSVQLYDLTFSPDGKRLVACFAWPEAPVTVLIDVADGSNLPWADLQIPPTRHFEYSPDGRWIAFSGGIVDAETGHLLLDESGAGIFSRNGRVFASANSGIVRAWTTSDWKPVTTFAAETVSAMCLSPDGRTLAIAGERTMKLWNVATGRELLTLADDFDAFPALAFSPDGTMLAAAGRRFESNELRIWDLKDAAVDSPTTDHRRLTTDD